MENTNVDINDNESLPIICGLQQSSFFRLAFILTIFVIFCVAAIYYILSNDEIIANLKYIKNESSSNLTNSSELILELNHTYDDDVKSADLREISFFSIYKSDQHKLLYCAIQKNACEMFKNLLFGIKNNNLNISGSRSIHKNIQKDRMKPIQKDTYISILNDKSWNKLVIIRDPLERLLSGFLDKCIRWPFWCEGKRTNHFYQFAKRIIDKLGKGEKMNNHFQPQSSFGGLQNQSVFNHYNHIINYHHESIENDTLSFLKKIGKEQYYYHWGLYQNETMFMIHSNVSQRHITYRRQSNQSIISFYNQYYTKRIAGELLKAFHFEYRLFHLPRPSWINNLSK